MAAARRIGAQLVNWIQVYLSGNRRGTATFTNAQGVQFANLQGANDSGTGFAVGGGVEYAWTTNWIVRAEYLFVDIDHHDVTLTDPVTKGGAGFSFSSTVGEQFSVVRGAISYKF